MAVNSPIATTLLIVESPIIAWVIQHFQIPGLICLPTNGYAWFPEYDLKTNILKAKANPHALQYRNEINKTAQYVSKIIIATDNDISGDFIAWSLLTKVKFNGIFNRGFISSISKENLIKLIHESTFFQPIELKTKLLNYFKVRNYTLSHFRLSSKNISFHELLCLSAYSSLKKSNFRQRLNLIPLNTGAVLSKVYNTSYRKTYQILTSLHSTLTGQGQSIISYPRTNQHSYNKQTWERLTNIGFSFVNNFIPLPEYNRSYAEPGSHESIHTVELKLTPEKTRHLLPRESYPMYEFIYESTAKSIQPVYDDSILIKDDYMLMETLVNTCFISASSLPNIMDELVDKNLLTKNRDFNHKLFNQYLREVKVPNYKIWQSLNSLIIKNCVSDKSVKEILFRYIDQNE